MIKISTRGLELIKKFEGFSALPYLCPADKMTIGYGHVILPHEKFPDSGIDKAQAEMLLRDDIAKIENPLSLLVTRPPTQCQWDALCSLIYNIGLRAFENSTLLRIYNSGNSAGAARQFGRWIYSNGVILQGLITRRAEESALFLETEKC